MKRINHTTALKNSDSSSNNHCKQFRKNRTPCTQHHHDHEELREASLTNTQTNTNMISIPAVQKQCLLHQPLMSLFLAYLPVIVPVSEFPAS